MVSWCPQGTGTVYFKVIKQGQMPTLNRCEYCRILLILSGVYHVAFTDRKSNQGFLVLVLVYVTSNKFLNHALFPICEQTCEVEGKRKQ